jgi:hypothetical protein
MRGVAGRLRRASRAQRLGWVPAAAAREERSEGSNDRRNGQGQDGHRAPLVAEQRIVYDLVLLQEWLVICYKESDAVGLRSLETCHERLVAGPRAGITAPQSWQR